MKKNVSSQSMDATLQTFLGNLSSKETPRLEPQPAATQGQTSVVVQETANVPIPEQTDETPQAPQARVPQPQHARCPRPHRPYVR